jgi:hypothetical protein
MPLDAIQLALTHTPPRKACRTTTKPYQLKHEQIERKKKYEKKEPH